MKGLKQLISIALLLFVGASVVYLSLGERGDTKVASAKDRAEAEVCVGGEPCGRQVVADTDASSNDTVVAYYFHRTARCRTCHALEGEARKAIEANFSDELAKGTLLFKSLNVEEASNRHFIQEYQITGPSLVLSKMNGQSEADWKNLDQIWRLIRTPDVYRQYVVEEVRALMGASS